MGPVDDSVTTNTKSPSHKVTKGAGPTRAAWSAVAFSLVLAVCVLTGMQGRALNMGSCSGMKHPGRERLSRPLPHWRQLVAGQLLVDGQPVGLFHLLRFEDGISQLATVYAAVFGVEDDDVMTIHSKHLFSIFSGGDSQRFDYQKTRFSPSKKPESA